jgi:hypothetical protein
MTTPSDAVNRATVVSERHGSYNEYMRTIEFETNVTESGQLSVPADAASGLPPGTRARVIVVVPDADDLDVEALDRLAARSISEYYCREDAIYDDYPRG